jgi:peptidoglycan biosynthesis protein MviN/MurJ (putative lipid II flippase)
VASAFLALGPSLIGWSLIEILARSLFALDRPWPPVIRCLHPVLINVGITLRVGAFRPEYLGLGASVGLISGFAVLFLIAHTGRKRWLKQD